MLCPYCEGKEFKVVDSRHTDANSIRRRRECESCKRRFTTYEKIEVAPMMVIKKDGAREILNRDKIKHGIIVSCEKRPIATKDIDKVVDEVEYEINKNFTSEVSSTCIGKLVMDKLKKLDEVAYVRFASVYREFKDIETFVKELEIIRKECNCDK